MSFVPINFKKKKKIMKVSLSFNQKNLENVERDFTIIVNNTKEYKFHSFLLFSFSPKLRRLFLSDPCIRSVRFPLPDNLNLFSEIEKIIYQQKFQKPQNLERANWFLKVANYFENSEFCKYASNACLSYMKFHDFDFSLSIPALIGPISYITQNFAEKFNYLPIDRIPLQVFDCILYNNDIKINESALFACIIKIIRVKRSINDPNWPMYYGLFSHIQFEYLNNAEIEAFIKECPSDAISGALWKAICRRLKKPIFISQMQNYSQQVIPQQQQQAVYQMSYQQQQFMQQQQQQIQQQRYEQQQQQQMSQNEDNFAYHGDPFNGVFNYLRSYNSSFSLVIDCGGNKRWAIPYLFEYNDDTKYWENSDSDYLEQNQWLLIGFEEYRLKLKNYTLGHSLKGPNNGQPKHWKLFGSDDTQTWVQIDEVNNATELNKKQAHHTYTIKNPSRYFHYFKFQQISNWSKKPAMRYKFVLGAVEFFGNLESTQN